jgi:hypothetical protein
MSTLNVTTIIPKTGTNTDLAVDGEDSGLVAVKANISVAGSLWRNGTDLKVSTG